MFGLSKRELDEKEIMYITKLFTNTMYEIVLDLGLDGESPLSLEDSKLLLSKISSHKNTSVQINIIPKMLLESAIETIMTVVVYGNEYDMYCYPGTVVDILSRAYATAVLGGHAPDERVTRKMVDIVHTKFDNLGKL